MWVKKEQIGAFIYRSLYFVVFRWHASIHSKRSETGRLPALVTDGYRPCKPAVFVRVSPADIDKRTVDAVCLNKTFDKTFKPVKFGVITKSRNFFQRFLTTIPPWILIGAAAIMLPVVALMAREHLNRQKAYSVRLLTEKGAALIRSFEAGARHGMMGMGRSGFRLQRLLMETAKQPDIVYLAVVEKTGTIVAHSDSEQIGDRYGFLPEAVEVEKEKQLFWRTVEHGAGRRVFEVYRQFEPISGSGMMEHRHRGMMRSRAGRSFPESSQTARYIFVGLDMEPIDAAQKADFQHTIAMALILLLIGFSGIVLLLMVQSSRSIRASLSRVRAFSDNLLEHMPIGLLALSDRMRIASLNPAGAEILGLSAQEAIGRPASETIPEALLSFTEELLPGRNVLAREIDCPTPSRSGSRVPLEVSASLLRDDDGKFLGTIILFTDIGEVQGLRREVARSQRLASIGRLAAGVAHEIRNPLSSIKGFATVFRERYRNVPDDQETAVLMVQEVDRLNRVVTQLLDFSRPVTVTRKPIRIDDLLEDIRRLIAERAAKSGMSVCVRTPGNAVTVQTDPDQVRQVLLNLSLNALDAMSEGGELLLSAAPEKGGGCRIQVEDTGIGIPESDLGRIFDPYFTTKHSGTGLGLAIVHNIVDALGGTINVESRSGSGTKVTIALDKYEEKHELAENG